MVNLNEAAHSVINNLTGQDYIYTPDDNAWQMAKRAIIRALQHVSKLEEWNHYVTVRTMGKTTEGQRDFRVLGGLRTRVTGGDAVTLSDGTSTLWVPFIEHSVLNRYARSNELRCAVLRDRVVFSRPLRAHEAGREIGMSVMRAPRLPDAPTDEIDFHEPDLVVQFAMYFFAQHDPVMQPRVQTLQEEAMAIFYLLQERNNAFTDSPDYSEWSLGIEAHPSVRSGWLHDHPHADFQYGLLA